MEDIQQQLAALRRRIAQYRPQRPICRPRRAAPPRSVPALFDRGVHVGRGGPHPAWRALRDRARLGAPPPPRLVDISDLAELPEDLLDRLSEGAIPSAHPVKWAFLDTETTGLAGRHRDVCFPDRRGVDRAPASACASSSCAITAKSPRCCAGSHEHLAQFDVLITYNGKAYDQPLLETRFRMCARAAHPFDRMQHLDLLFGARRLWKLRLDSCRLVDLENQVLGVEREGDLPGEMIPYCYFDFLRTQARVQGGARSFTTTRSTFCRWPASRRSCRSPTAARKTRRCATAPISSAWRDGCSKSDRDEEALRLFRRAVELGLPDTLLFRTMWDIAAMERRAGRHDAALAIITELAESRNPYRARALRSARQTLRASRAELRDGAGVDAAARSQSPRARSAAGGRSACANAWTSPGSLDRKTRRSDRG